MKPVRKVVLPVVRDSVPDRDEMREALEAMSAAEEVECVPYDPSKDDGLETVWMTDGERELTWREKLRATVFRLRRRK